MSKIYAALQKAEEERRQRPGARSAAPVPEPAGAAPKRRDDLLGYEQMRVWLRSPAGPATRLRTVMIVACHSGSGATTTAALFAKTLTEGKRSRVLLVDGNFRTPGLNVVFKVPNDGGFGDVTTEVSSLDRHIQKTDRENLFVLTSGVMPTAPLDAFDEEVVDDLLSELRTRFDFIVIDGAPVLDFPDALALASKVDGVILVVASEQTLIEDAQRAKRELERAGAKLVGVVLNRHQEVMPAMLQRFLGCF